MSSNHLTNSGRQANGQPNDDPMADGEWDDFDDEEGGRREFDFEKFRKFLYGLCFDQFK